MPDTNGFSAEEMAMLMPLFTQSSGEYLEQFRGALACVAAGEADDATREVLQRSVHSLKGAALQLGILHIGQLALAVEGVAKALRDVPQTIEDMETQLLNQSVERLSGYIADLAEGRDSTEHPADLIAQLENLSERLAAEGGSQAAEQS